MPSGSLPSRLPVRRALVAALFLAAFTAGVFAACTFGDPPSPTVTPHTGADSYTYTPAANGHVYATAPPTATPTAAPTAHTRPRRQRPRRPRRQRPRPPRRQRPRPPRRQRPRRPRCQRPRRPRRQRPHRPRVLTATPTAAPTATPTAAPTTEAAGLSAMKWLEDNRPALASAIMSLPWVADGIEGIERQALRA